MLESHAPASWPVTSASTDEYTLALFDISSIAAQLVSGKTTGYNPEGRRKHAYWRTEQEGKKNKHQLKQDDVFSCIPVLNVKIF